MMRKRAMGEPEPYEMSRELASQVDEMIEQAEFDVEEVRVNIRWRKVQLDVIKRAADRYGLPYQTYIKLAAFRQALGDLKETEGVASAGKGRKRA